jgi:polyferredoxin
VTAEVLPEPAGSHGRSNTRIIFGSIAGIVLVLAAGGNIGLHFLTRGIWSVLLTALVTILWIFGAIILFSVVRSRTGFLAAAFAVQVIRLVRLLSAIALLIILPLRVVVIQVSRSWSRRRYAMGPALPTLSVEQLEEIFNRLLDQREEAKRQQQRRGRWKRRSLWVLGVIFAAIVGWLMNYYIPAPPHAYYPPSHTAGPISFLISSVSPPCE